MVPAPVVLVVRGTEFRLHSSFAFLAFVLVLVGHRAGGPEGAAWSLASTLLAAASVLHGELARRLLLARCGIATRETWLTPVGGVLRVSRAAESLAARLALAFGSVPGALSLVVLACAVLALEGAAVADIVRIAPFRGRLVAELLWINVALAVAQLSPLLPGGLARFVLSGRGEGRAAAERMARAAVAARIVGLGTAVVGLLVAPALALAGVLVYEAASVEQRLAAWGEARITGRFGQQY